MLCHPCSPAHVNRAAGRARRRPVGRAAGRLLSLVSAVVVVTLTASAAAASADVLGIDVSRYQHNPSIDWGAVDRDGVGFAFIKATEGVGYTNAYYSADAKASAAAGIYRGAYHFARPDTRTGDAAAEARYFAGVVGSQRVAGTLPPVLDLEASGGLSVSALTAWTTTWLTTVEQLTGRTPIIYVSPSFWEHYLGNSRAFARYPLWIAHYGVSAPRVPGGWPTWTFWQGTSTGRVSGIVGNVDLNAFQGTNTQLRALALVAPTPAPAPTPTPTPTPSPPPVTPVVDDAPTPTTATLTAGRRTVLRGRSVTLTGTLRDATGTAVPRRPVTIATRAASSTRWTSAHRVRTDAAGRWTATLPVPVSTSYRAQFAGGALYAPSTSPAATVTVRTRAATVAELVAEHPSLRRGGVTRLYGHLRTRAGAAVVGHTLRVYGKRPGATGPGAWQPVGTARSVAPTGWYQLNVSPSRTTVYKATWAGGPVYAATTSSWARVTVE